MRRGWPDFVRHLADVDDELIPVRRINADGQDEWCLVGVITRPACLDDRYASVIGQLETICLSLVGCANLDLVAPAHKLGAVLAEVRDSSFSDISRLQKLDSALLDQPHRVEGSLQRPEPLINESLLVTTDDLGTSLKLEFRCQILICQLDLYARGRDFWPPEPRREFRSVRRALYAEYPLDVSVGRGQRGNERIDPFRDEHSLPGRASTSPRVMSHFIA